MLYQFKDCCPDGSPRYYFWKEMKGNMMCTPGEPIYPDISSIPFGATGIVELPEWIVHLMETEVDWDSLEPGENMYYTIPDSFYARFPEVMDFFNVPEDHKNYILDVNKIDELEIPHEKPRNPGKPANNNDPYPIDHKIAQLQMHHPQVKINEVRRCGPSDEYFDLITYIIAMSDWTEKRLVQIENIMSKQIHYLHRLSSRVNINCVYYGGQKEDNKYECIRCLHDDLISDGQIMTLDQCLNCSRYEPILGKTYDIIDESARNISILYDDNQKQYQSMEEHFDSLRTERMYQNPTHEIARIDQETIEDRPHEYETFKERWPEGEKMRWCDTSIEGQRPNIANWGNDFIYKDYLADKVQGPNADRPIDETIDFIPPIDLDKIKEVEENIEENIEDFEENPVLTPCSDYDSTVSAAWEASKQNGRDRGRDAIKKMEEVGYRDHIVKHAQANGLDPSLILAIISVESRGVVGTRSDGSIFTGLMQVPIGQLTGAGWNESLSDYDKADIEIKIGSRILKQKMDSFSNSNTMLGIVAYNAGEGMIKGTPGPAEGIENSERARDLRYLIPDLPEDRSSWKFREVASCIIKNALGYFQRPKKEEEIATFYPRVIFSYEYIRDHADGIFAPETINPTRGLMFPIPVESRGNTKLSSPYGERVIDGKEDYHRGHDYTGQGGITPVVAAANGKITKSGWMARGGGYSVIIKHDYDNMVTRYLHMYEGSLTKNEGDRVKMGEVIGMVGSTGFSTGDHLHFDIEINGTRVDPQTVYTKLRPIVKKYLDNNRQYQSLAGLDLDVLDNRPPMGSGR